jgi:GH25 family lysozyme M1 (1,4-beta-N-acetylmuramidase)
MAIAAALVLSFGTGRALAQRAMGMDSDFHCCSVNFKTAAAAGIQFACIKATAPDESFSNSVFSSRMSAAQAAGVYTLPYNRCDPSVFMPKTEAQFFWSWTKTSIAAGGYNLSPALDVEDGLTGSYIGDTGGAISLAGW